MLIFAALAATIAGCHGVDGMRLLLHGGGFHFRDPINAEFGRDFEDIDSTQDAWQRARKIIQTRDKMLQAGYEPVDIFPYLHGRADLAIADALRPNGQPPTAESEQQAEAIERLLGRSPVQRLQHRVEVISH